MVDFGSRLQQLRLAAGLTQAQLAQKSGLTQGAISRWEKGGREPGWSEAIALAAALGVTCEAFTQEPAPSAPPVSQPAADSSPPRTRKRKQ